jgi:hypothetical protein
MDSCWLYLRVVGLPRFAQPVNVWCGRTRILLGTLACFSRLRPRILREEQDAGFAWVPLIWRLGAAFGVYCSGIPGSGVGAGVVTDAGGFLRAFVAAAFLPAALRVRVVAALRPAALRFRVPAAFVAAARRLRVVAAFRAAARSLRVAAAFFPALCRLGLIVCPPFPCGHKLNRNFCDCARPAFWRHR